MKRIFVILGLTLLILAGCGNNEPSYQDEAFIKDLASNLDERWSYQEKVADDEVEADDSERSTKRRR